MRYVELAGKNVSVIGLGTWQFGSPEWGFGTDFGESEATSVFTRALDLGMNFIDTAEVYGRGRSEEIIGRALGDRRGEAYIATKVLPVFPTAARVVSAARGSLARLGVDTIDLYQVHWPNPVVPVPFTMEGMKRLLRDGAIGEVGVSNFPLWLWRWADQSLGRPVVTNQVQFSLVRRMPERRLLPWAQRQGRHVIAYSPLAQGVLSGKYTADNAPGGVRRANSLFTRSNLERLQPVLDALREVADAHDATPSQIALAWTVHRPNVIAIPGAKSVAQLESNAAAGDIDLKEDEYDALTQAADRFHKDRVGAVPDLARRLVNR